MVTSEIKNIQKTKRSIYIQIWTVSAIVVPIFLDYIFFGSSIARYSRVLIFFLITFSLLLNSESFLRGKLVGFDTILLMTALFLVGTYSSYIRGGAITPNFALLLMLTLIVSLNFDLYKIALKSVGLSCQILVYVSLIVILLKLNPRNFNFSSVGYPVFLDGIGISGRNYGIFSHPNTLGQVSVLSIFFLFGSRIKPYLLIAPILCILKCGSRTAIISLIVGILFYLVASLIKISRFSQNKRFESTFTTGILIICFLLASSFQFLNYINFLDPEALTGRVSIWQSSLLLFKESHFLGLGWGWEQRAIESQLLNIWAVSSHNVFLEILFSSGLLGFILYLTIITKPIIHFTKYGITEKLILVSVTISGISESAIDLQYPTVQTLVFFIIVLGVNFENRKLK